MKKKVVDEIVRYVKDSEWNQFEEIGGHCFDEPLVRCVSAEDPIFESYKEIIHSEHPTPKEAFEKTFGAGSFSGGTVISMVLPIGETIRESNRTQTEKPSKVWSIFNYEGGFFMEKMLKHLEAYLQSLGYRTVAPAIADWYVIKPFGEPPVLGSNWSERHVAYAAGLGTVSINEGFISERGIAVRLASVVTELILDPDSRTDKKPMGNCLLHSKGICGACITRCPAKALSKEGHDKMKCWKFAYGPEMKALAASYGAPAGSTAGCSLCQTRVPCECRNPMQND